MMKLVVLSGLLAAASAGFIPAYTAYSSPLLLAQYQPPNYRGPLSLPPGHSADILAADGRPLDTLEVNLDRAAHYTAKALDSATGIHLLKKRSAPIASVYSPYLYSAYAAPFLAPYNYRGPLSLAPGQPANILGADGRPLDTLDVNLDRAAHFASKAASGIHLLKKRSAPIITPISPIVPATYAAPVAVSAPLAYSTYFGYGSPYIGAKIAAAPISYAFPLKK